MPCRWHINRILKPRTIKQLFLSRYFDNFSSSTTGNIGCPCFIIFIQHNVATESIQLHVSISSRFNSQINISNKLPTSLDNKTAANTLGLEIICYLIGFTFAFYAKYWSSISLDSFTILKCTTRSWAFLLASENPWISTFLWIVHIQIHFMRH